MSRDSFFCVCCCGFPRPRLPAGRAVFPRLSLPAGRDFGPVRTCGAFPPTAARQAPPVHEATGGYAVRSPCPSGIPRPRHNASLPWAAGISTVLTFWLHRFSSLGLKSGIDVRIALVLASLLHRFASLGLKSRIDARSAPVLAFWLHRFAILGLKSGITAAPSCRRVEWPACGRSLPPRCRVRFQFSSPQSRTVPPAAPSCRQVERPKAQRLQLRFQRKYHL